MSTLAERFWSKVSVAGPDDCWLWTGAKMTGNYGTITIQLNPKRAAPAHRVSYKLNVGEIPSGMLVCHSCDTPPCVNPAHLFLGTTEDNMHDMMKKGRGRWNTEPLTRKLIPDQIREIRELHWQKGINRSELARRFEVSRTTIIDICDMVSWKDTHPVCLHPARIHITDISGNNLYLCTKHLSEIEEGQKYILHDFKPGGHRCTWIS